MDLQLVNLQAHTSIKKLSSIYTDVLGGQVKNMSQLACEFAPDQSHHKSTQVDGQKKLFQGFINGYCLV